MKSKKLIDQEHQELQLESKAFRKRLSIIKKRRNVTTEELKEMREESIFWDKRLHMRKKLTSLDELKFNNHMELKRLRIPKIKSMIMRHKPGIYNEYFEELNHLGISVYGLLLQLHRLKEDISLLNLQIEHEKYLKEYYESLYRASMGIPQKRQLRVEYVKE
jgi:hypothetical protein